MNLEDLLARALANGSDDGSRDGDSCADFISIKGFAATAWREKFIPIKNLQPGDIVTWKTSCRNLKRPRLGEEVEVFSIIDPPLFGHQMGFKDEDSMARFDFTIAVLVPTNNANEKCFQIINMDSRRFELVRKVGEQK